MAGLCCFSLDGQSWPIGGTSQVTKEAQTRGLGDCSVPWIPAAAIRPTGGRAKGGVQLGNGMRAGGDTAGNSLHRKANNVRKRTGRESCVWPQAVTQPLRPFSWSVKWTETPAPWCSLGSFYKCLAQPPQHMAAIWGTVLLFSSLPLLFA